MAITRGQMQRQLRRGGGIMNIAPREQFGLGSKLKRAVRKIIPNEVAKVATVAAPFVAPFNPALAGAMAGIGSFDQTGSLSGALKSGALTYGGGQLARFAGGAGFQGNPFTSGGAFTPSGFTAGFSSPFGTETGIGKLLSDRAAAKGQLIKGQGVQPINAGTKAAETAMETRDLISAGQAVPGADPGTFVSPLEYKQFTPSFSEGISTAVTESAPESVMKAIKNKDYGQAAKLAAEKGFNAVFKKPIRNDAGKIIGYDLDKNTLFAAGAFGLTYLDAKKVADEAGVDIGTETEYDEATKAAKKEEYADYLTNFFEGKKDGGRIGFDEGANTKFAMIKDMLAKGMDEETIMSIAEATQADIDSVKKERVEEAQGGRIGFADGTDKKLKEILEMDMTIPKNRDDPRNMTTNEIIFAIEDGRATPEMFEELLLRDVGGISTLMLDEIGGKKLDEPKKVYEFNPSESRQGGAIENFLFKLRESNPDIYGEYSRPRLEKDRGYRDKPIDMAKGGRIGYKFGDRVEDDEGIMSMSEDKEDEDMKMAYFPGDVFSKAEISRLFSDKSLTTNQDRKNLYRILMNPGMFPEAEDMLKKLLRGKKEGGRIGFRGGSNRMMETFRMLEKAIEDKDMDLAEELKTILRNEFSQKLAKGGRINYNMGSEVPVRKNKAGIEELDYRQTGGFVPVGVKEKADDVPAMLSKNEFVLTADAVRGIGGGDVEKGAEKLYGVMKQAEKVGRA